MNGSRRAFAASAVSSAARPAWRTDWSRAGCGCQQQCACYEPRTTHGCTAARKALALRAPPHTGGGGVRCRARGTVRVAAVRVYIQRAVVPFRALRSSRAADPRPRAMSASPLSALSARALAAGPLRSFAARVPASDELHVPSDFHPAALLPVHHPDEQPCISFHHFPHGQPVYCLHRAPFPQDCMAYRPADGLLVLCSHRPQDPSPTPAFLSVLQMCQDATVAFVANLSALPRVHYVDVAEDNFFLLVHQHQVVVYRLRDMCRHTAFGVPKRETVTMAKFVKDNHVVVATNRGVVYLFDLRDTTHSCVWTVTPNQFTNHVADVQVSNCANHLFVASVLQNSSQHSPITAWDFRASSPSRSTLLEPVLSFSKHVSCSPQEFMQTGCKPLPFALEQRNGGLLLAAGRDAYLRIWDTKRGGHPLDQISLNHLMPDQHTWPTAVQTIQSYNNSNLNTLAFWISTQKSFISIQPKRIDPDHLIYHCSHH